MGEAIISRRGGKYDIGGVIAMSHLAEAEPNEVWSKTDVANGYGVAVDSSGNVYCAHYVSSGSKAIRKLAQGYIILS